MATAAGKAQIKYAGFAEADTLFVGQSISAVRDARGDAWSIPSDAKAFRGKDQLDENYIIQSGDVIEFHRRMGEKG